MEYTTSKTRYKRSRRGKKPLSGNIIAYALLAALAVLFCLMETFGW